MMSRILTIGLFITLFVACSEQSDRPGFIILPGMVKSIPYDAYDANPVTGQTLQTLPDGTVPFGFVPFDYDTGEAEALRAGRELQNPIDAAIDDGGRGKEVYDTFCYVCHGTMGVGDGPIIGRFPNPPSLLTARAANMPDGQVFHIITHGQGLMPAYKWQVPTEDRWRSINYVRDLQAQSGVDVANAGGAQ